MRSSLAPFIRLLFAAIVCSSCRDSTPGTEPEDTHQDSETGTREDTSSSTEPDDTQSETDDCEQPEVVADCKDGWCKMRIARIKALFLILYRYHLMRTSLFPTKLYTIIVKSES